MNKIPPHYWLRGQTQQKYINSNLWSKRISIEFLYYEKTDLTDCQQKLLRTKAGHVILEIFVELPYAIRNATFSEGILIGLGVQQGTIGCGWV